MKLTITKSGGDRVDFEGTLLEALALLKDLAAWLDRPSITVTPAPSPYIPVPVTPFYGHGGTAQPLPEAARVWCGDLPLGQGSVCGAGTIS